VSLLLVVRLAFTELEVTRRTEMPLNVRRFNTSLLLVIAGIVGAASAQTVPPATSATPAPTQPSLSEPIQQVVRTPTAAEIMRDRISKAKAYIAVRNYNAANYELESIRRESADTSVLAVVNVLLMNSYLEQGDYKRAQDFLNDAYKLQTTTKPGAADAYFAVAGQIVRGARNRVERYRSLGLNPSDRMLPLEAINDLEKMRETLELVVTQSKEISKNKVKSPDAMALLEEASVSRSMIARDDYDASKWQNEVADTREDLASSRSVVLSAVTDAPTTSAPSNQTVALNQQPQGALIANTGYTQPTSSPASNQPLVKPTVSSQPINSPQQVSDNPQYIPIQQPDRSRVIPNQPVSQAPIQSNTATSQPVNKRADQPTTQPAVDSSTTSKSMSSGPSAEPAKDTGPINVGLLLPYAAKQQAPVYPPAARQMRTAGVVNVTVTIDEQGNVAEIQNATGPGMLQSAAKDAIRKWHFKPFVRDGQPVKAVGYVSFNFTL
jgi:TonB family protein